MKVIYQMILRGCGGCTVEQLAKGAYEAQKLVEPSDGVMIEHNDRVYRVWLHHEEISNPLKGKGA